MQPLKIRSGGLLLLGMLWLAAGCGPSASFRGTAVDPAQAAPEVAGVNWDGSPFQLSDQRGRVSILFFGYASCPDVCPMTLSRMKRLFTQLGGRAEEVAVVFISVDPERDSQERLASYVPAFDERFFGVHLEPEELEEVTAGYDVSVRRHPPKSPGGYYAVDHTGTLFLVDGRGDLRVQLPHDAPVEDLRADVLSLLEPEA